MKAYLLARVSTEDQKDALPAQVIRLKDYAQKQSYDYELFEIQESAYSGDRKFFRVIVDQIDKEPQPVIVVLDKIDRLTRDPTSDEYIRLIKMCNKGLIELHFPSDSIKVHKDSSATIKMMLNLGVGGAQYYSSSISDNVKRRQSQMLRDGIWTGAAPFGYRYVMRPGGKKWLELDPVESAIVRATYDAYARGTTTLKEQSRRWLNEHGIKTPHSRIEKILKNPFYYGQMRIKGVLYPHHYDPIITHSLFEKVQAVLTGYAAKPHRWAGLPYAYRGLIYCDECGCKVTFEKKKGKYIYGHCTQFKYRHDATYVNEDSLTEQFSKLLSNIHIPDENYKEIVEVIESTKGNETARIESQRSTIQTEINKYETRLEKMYTDRLDGLIPDSVYEQKYQEFKKMQHTLTERLQNIELLDSERMDEYSHLVSLANKAPKLFKEADYLEKREILNLVLSNLTLNGKKLGWKYKKPYDLMAFCNETSSWQAMVRRPTGCCSEPRRCWIA